MSKCDLTVRYESAERTFRPGDTIRGDVVVRANEDVEAKKLAIVLRWRTHGAGNRAVGVVDETVVEPPPWKAGGTYTYPFRFEAPHAPLTYRGHLLNVDHEVAASADVAWAIDPKGAEEYVLIPGPTSRTDYLAAPFDATEIKTKQKTSTAGKILGWIFAPLILVLLVMVLALVLVLLPIILVVWIVNTVRRKAAEKRLGRVSVELRAPLVGGAEPPPSAVVGRLKRKKKEKKIHAIAPGDKLGVAVRFQPQSSFPVDAVTATLLGQEICRSGSGTNATTHTHDVCKDELTLIKGMSYAAGMPVALDGELAVPDVHAWSFKATDNRTEWKLRVRVDLPGWPDWVEEWPLAMVPGEKTGS